MFLYLLEHKGFDILSGNAVCRFGVDTLIVIVVANH